jgi:hypothetical protein
MTLSDLVNHFGKFSQAICNFSIRRAAVRENLSVKLEKSGFTSGMGLLEANSLSYQGNLAAD